jgi:hypothetical protein
VEKKLVEKGGKSKRGGEKKGEKEKFKVKVV